MPVNVVSDQKTRSVERTGYDKGRNPYRLRASGFLVQVGKDILENYLVV